MGRSFIGDPDTNSAYYYSESEAADDDGAPAPVSEFIGRERQ